MDQEKEISSENPSETPSSFSFISGALCLDFINTAGWYRDTVVSDGLASYGELLLWAREAGVLSATEADILSERCSRDAAISADALNNAREVRALLQRLFQMIEAGAQPNAETLARFNEALAVTLSTMRLALDDGSFRWTWAEHGCDNLRSPLSPIIWSAATLLLSEDRHRVRSCAGRYCGWFYIDRSRNGLRRWCSMASCGSRAKARRHYQRRRDRSRVSDPATLLEA